MDFIKVKNVLCIEENFSENEKQATECEKIFANHIFDKGLFSKICKELLQLKKKKRQLNLNMGNRHMKRCSASLVIKET